MLLSAYNLGGVMQVMANNYENDSDELPEEFRKMTHEQVIAHFNTEITKRQRKDARRYSLAESKAMFGIK